MEGLNIRMKGKEERINELKIRQYKLSNWNNRENRLKKKMKRSSRSCESKTKNLIFMLTESQKDRRKWTGMKKYPKK